MSITERLRGRGPWPALRIVDGGPRSRPPVPSLPVPAPPGFGSSELAADMARLFAVALVADCPVAALSDPHHVVTRGAGTGFSLHDLLCELRSLPWNDPFNAALAVDPGCPETEQSRSRRVQRWNADGQLTLGNLFRSGIARPVPGGLVSGALVAVPAGRTLTAPVAPPEASAPLSDWVVWCAMQSGAGLRLPCDRAGALPDTLAGLAARIMATHPAQPFHTIMLGAFARGVPLDAGLAAPQAAAPAWSAARCVALLAEAEARALRVVSRAVLQADRPTRPVVTAARMTVILSRDSMACGAEGAKLRAAAEELATFAPGLLDWISRANRADRGTGRFGQNLFLPLGPAAHDPAHPSDLARHVVVAGALATLVKALFDTSSRLRIPRPGEAAPDPSLADDADGLAGNVCLARTVACTHYPAEDHVELRAGEAIAIHLLRDALEADNRSASVGFRDFDGRETRIVAHPRSFGRGRAGLFADGEPRPWPQDADRRAAHLTAVV